ncbi:hypothetical protein [Rheinheimera aquimaris]|uniref:hypothetical protein n=1 Tax=Rheinheimera aquimaris TaxID=412437 RepID=UPI001E46CBDF|nr:hypothetical protein [Rheinheimera aquimaris]MCD1597820.1 hypothetical protein [Rheinheimera aquimaris]
MSTIIRTVLTSLLLFMLPIAAYQAYTILIIGSCDPKFGCWGSFKLSLLIGSAYGFISLVALIAVQLVSKANMLNALSVLVTLLLGAAHWFMFSIEFLDSLTMQVAFWLVLSGVLYSLAAVISKKYNKQSQPTRTAQLL